MTPVSDGTGSVSSPLPICGDAAPDLVIPPSWPTRDGGYPPYWMFRQLAGAVTAIGQPDEALRGGLAVITPGLRS